MDAGKLAIKVKRVLEKQIKTKGYETEAILLTSSEINPRKLSLEDSEDDTPFLPEMIKIVVTSHTLQENPTEVGDNPDVVLDFIVIEDGSESVQRQVQEGKILIYNNKKYIIDLVSPATLAGQLIIKEVTAKDVK
ncbi:hypothetical protein [Bacillus sp. 3255]|uniref:hypothetical protein n=1 Tax=Bacillus sp. 3255 TaxID=2817904 RepID=UPI00285D42EA|nr:hypothetical protein [Bacillus sp. 3255]MDR6883026.1 hypothetical protein [Bacillus sp. 3255]